MREMKELIASLEFSRTIPEVALSHLTTPTLPLPKPFLPLNSETLSLEDDARSWRL